MSRDLSEYIDDYCSDTYGHTNWGHKDDFSTKFLSENEHEIKNNIVFFEEDFDLNKSEVK